MKVEHTPGPWQLSNRMQSNGGRDEGWFWVSADRTLHLKVFPCSDGYVVGENEANARLIATAPELLTALESAVETIEWLRVASNPAEDEIERAIASAQAIIRKARGKDE